MSTAPSHEPKYEINRGIFNDEKVLMFANLLENVTRSFLIDGLRKVAENEVSKLRLRVESKDGYRLLGQFFTVGLDRIKVWSENELKDEESRVLTIHNELPDLYHYAAVTMAQSFVKDVTAEIRLELPSFRSFLFQYYQTLAAQPYIRSMNYFDNWHLETQALIQDVVRYSLYNMVHPNLKYEGRGRAASTVTTKDIVRFKQDPIEAMDQLGIDDDHFESVSQVGAGEPQYFDPTPVADLDNRSHHSSRSVKSRRSMSSMTQPPPVQDEDAKSHHSHASHRSHKSHRSSVPVDNVEISIDADDNKSHHSSASHASHASRRSSASRKSIVQDARSILSQARSKISANDAKASRHDDGTFSVIGSRVSAKSHRSRRSHRSYHPTPAPVDNDKSDTRSRVDSVISLHLSDAALIPIEEDNSPKPEKKKRRRYDSDSDSDSSYDSDSDSDSDSDRRSRKSMKSNSSRASSFRF